MNKEIQEIPETLKKDPALNTTEKIEEKLKTVISEIFGYKKENTTVYDVTLNISNDKGTTWTKATPENFPMEGLTITLPYPEGTDPVKHDYVVTHMFTTNYFGKVPGETEQPAVTETENGLRFIVTGLSPIAVAWKESEIISSQTNIPVIKEAAVTGNNAKVVLSKKCEGMEGYDYVMCTDPNGITVKDYYKVMKNIRTPETTFRYMQKGTYYAFCHAWKRVNGKKEFSGWSEPYKIEIKATTPSAPKVTKAKISGSTVKVTYKASKAATGYDLVLGKAIKKANGETCPVQYGKLVKKNIKGDVVTVTFKNVPKGTYYIGLHAFNRTSEDGKKVFSPWSAVKKITVKK